MCRAAAGGSILNYIYTHKTDTFRHSEMYVSTYKISMLYCFIESIKAVYACIFTEETEYK